MVELDKLINGQEQLKEASIILKKYIDELQHSFEEESKKIATVWDENQKRYASAYAEVGKILEDLLKNK